MVAQVFVSKAQGDWVKAGSHQPLARSDGVILFRGLPVIPPPTQRTQDWSKHHPFPQPGMQLNLHIALFHHSAASPIFLRLLLLSPPPISMSLRKVAIKVTGKARNSTSIVHISPSIPYSTPLFWALHTLPSLALLTAQPVPNLVPWAPQSKLFYLSPTAAACPASS